MAAMCSEPMSRLGLADQEFLQQRWEDLARPYHTDQVVVEKWFKPPVELDLRRVADDHNLSHIRSLAVIADSVKKDIQYYCCLKCALWFQGSHSLDVESIYYRFGPVCKYVFTCG